MTDPHDPHEPHHSPGSPASLRTRGPELILALMLLGLGLIVIVDSLRVGTSWADDGPQAGYFPFFIGIGLTLASAFIGGAQLLRWKRDEREFAPHSALRTVWAMFWPMVLYVVAMNGLGLYLPSIVLVAYFMRRHGGFGWVPSLLIPLVVMLVVYLTFERWFLVLLPKGPLEAWMGL